MRRGVVVTGLAMVSMLGMTGDAHAQRRRSEPDAFFGISFVAGDPVGELALYIDQGFGAQLDGAIPLNTDGTFRLRMDLGFLVYGHERLQYCYTVPVGCRVAAELVTTNNIVYAGIGPELAFTMGPFEPYVFGTAGVSYFTTISSFNEEWGYDWSETTNYSDVVMARKLGSGFRLRVNRGPRPVSLDFGFERHWNGIADFLTEGDIVDNPDGSVTLYPNRSVADLTTFRFGVTFGVGGGRDD
jgi:hypothetical protein